MPISRRLNICHIDENVDVCLETWVNFKIFQMLFYRFFPFDHASNISNINLDDIFLYQIDCFENM